MVRKVHNSYFDENRETHVKRFPIKIIKKTVETKFFMRKLDHPLSEKQKDVMTHAIFVVLAFTLGVGIKVAIAFSIDAANPTPFPPAPPTVTNRIFALILPPANRPAPGHFASAN